MTCWQCGRTVQLLTAEKVNTRDTCPQCDADLHVCRNCRHFDPTSHNECREVMAEWVRYKDRNNYCDYFSPVTVVNPTGPRAGGKATPGDARQKFDQLFKK
ncbi:MAG TPA: hypothetical protein VMV31_09605 [Terriglobales bacterium]|nr:hypothetical protein [Terriglobales bacterium]